MISTTHIFFGYPRIVETFLQTQWRTLNNKDLAAAHEDYISQNDKKPGFMKQLSELVYMSHCHNRDLTSGSLANYLSNLIEIDQQNYVNCLLLLCNLMSNFEINLLIRFIFYNTYF